MTDEEVVEDFEDGSLDEYVEANQSAWDAYSGDFEIVQGSLSGSGGKYLKATSPNGDGANPEYASEEGSGLNYYPERGDKIEFHLRYTGESTPQFWFGLQSPENPREFYSLGFGARPNPSDTFEKVFLRSFEGGSYTRIGEDDTPLTNLRGEVLRTFIEWGDPTISVSV